eukprot:8536265-Pyramimonas_sp.AAC.1
MWPGNGVLLAPGSQNVAWHKVLGSPRFSAAPVQHLPRPPSGVMTLSFDPTRNLSVFAVR